MRVADLIYAKLPGYIDQELLDKTYKELYGGFNQAYTSGSNKLASHTIQEAVRYNLITFSGAKTAEQVEELRKAVFSSDANTLIPYSEFVKIALKIDEKYNLNYLQAEYDAVRRAGTMALKWQRIQRDARVYPLLRYRTVGDSAVRPQHAALEGITRPVNDPFWSTAYPPNGWNCRCTVEQLREGEITSDELTEQRTDEAKIPAEFRSNVGQSGTVFEKTHPYFQAIKSAPKPKRLSLARAVHNQYIQDGYLKEAFDEQTGGFVVRHPTHNLKSELAENLRLAKALAERGDQVVLMPISNRDGDKNPDALFNGQITDFKVSNGRFNSIQTAIRKANKQSKHAYIFVPDDKSVSVSTVFEYAKERLLFIAKSGPVNLEKVTVHQGEKVITRSINEFGLNK